MVRPVGRCCVVEKFADIMGRFNWTRWVTAHLAASVPGIRPIRTRFGDKGTPVQKCNFILPAIGNRRWVLRELVHGSRLRLKAEGFGVQGLAQMKFIKIPGILLGSRS